MRGLLSSGGRGQAEQQLQCAGGGVRVTLCSQGRLRRGLDNHRGLCPAEKRKKGVLPKEDSGIEVMEV